MQNIACGPTWPVQDSQLKTSKQERSRKEGRTFAAPAKIVCFGMGLLARVLVQNLKTWNNCQIFCKNTSSPKPWPWPWQWPCPIHLKKKYLHSKEPVTLLWISIFSIIQRCRWSPVACGETWKYPGARPEYSSLSDQHVVQQNGATNIILW